MKELVMDKIYYERNRYTDILTYNKSRVHLEKGVAESKHSEYGYINACYVNSPYEAEKGKGDKKIIAS